MDKKQELADIATIAGWAQEAVSNADTKGSEAYKSVAILQWLDAVQKNITKQQEALKDDKENNKES